MKMPRSHCENENVQFVQELAEVDGPFESPININFRDLTKLELPSLVWNHCEMAPKKMKITNTGHTVIISGKWKCERPYLTGGPLSGKYVFSQIHFHWGQDDCKGSEHQVCGEGFPLEMHVAHFKAEYASQENALREKDGMVVIVYLFKLQEEPNAALKKIFNCMSHVSQAGTSHVIDPRPILSLCNPFTDDYFMYWGSVITPTCAHILLWIVCREPFGISRDQVNEFRKLCNSANQPIFRNNRDPQPLHKRNVFHVNNSKNLEDPMLPIKKMMGCYCKGSEETVRMKQQANGGCCQPNLKNQEDIEENIAAEYMAGYGGRNYGGGRGVIGKVSLPRSFYVRQTFVVQKAGVKSVPQLSKWCRSDIKRRCSIRGLNRTKSEGYSNLKNVSQSCCFLPYKEMQKIKNLEGKRKVRDRKKPLASLRALTHIMDSLEALKNHTVKKLKEIESINQEIKGIKPFCQDSEDKKWLKKVEKIMSRQKRFTIKASTGCLGELRKIARECNFDKFFDNKTLPVENTENNKETWINENEVGEQALPCSDAKVHKDNINIEKTLSKPLVTERVVKLSAKAQRLVQSFFEDIKESEGLQQTVQKDIQLKKINSFGTNREQAGDSTSVASLTRGFITQKMFNLGNLGDRFFAEVTSDDIAPEENGWGEGIASNGLVVFEDENEQKKSTHNEEDSDKNANTNMEEVKVCSEPSTNVDEMIPLHRANVAISISEPAEERPNGSKDSLILYKNIVGGREPELPVLNGLSDTESTSCSESFYIGKKPKRKEYFNKSIDAYFRKQMDAVANYKLIKHPKTDNLFVNLQKSSSNLSTDSTDSQRMIIAKFHKKQSRKDICQKELSAVSKVSSKALYGKTSYRKLRNKLHNINLEGYYIKKKHLKHKRKKAFKNDPQIKQTPSSYDRSSTSRDEIKTLMTNSRWKGMAKTKFKLQIKKTSDSTLESAIEYSLLSPERKKLKLESRKKKGSSPRSRTLSDRTQIYFPDDDSRTFDIPKKFVNSKNKENVNLYLIKSKGNDEDDDDDEDDDEDDDDDDDEGDGVREITKSKKIKAEHPGIQNRTRIIVPRGSVNDSRADSRASTKKPSRATSADSRCSYSEKHDEKSDSGESTKVFIGRNENTDTSALTSTKNRSLTTLIARSKDLSSDANQRVFVESIDLRLGGRDAFQGQRRPESSRQEISPRGLIPRPAERGTLTESNKKTEREVKENLYREYNAELSSGFESESGRRNQQQESKIRNPPLKRCNTEKYHFLDEVLEENSISDQEITNADEKSRPESAQSDLNRSLRLEGPNMKGDATISTSENKELQTSVSYSALKKTPQSRSHSAESLSSLKKAHKWKGKKRPHCCKRSSKHYIRKNSSFSKKLNKTDNKGINFLGLTEEEQLKIISVNVAKYLQQRLVEGKTELEPNDKCTINETELVLKNLKASEEKPSPPNEPSSPVDEVKQEEEAEEEEEEEEGEGEGEREIPIENPVEAIIPEEKPSQPEHVKVDEVKEIKLEDPVKEKKLPSSPRPVHNFIKLNKLMAGKYKRSAIPVEKMSNIPKPINEPPVQDTKKQKPKQVRKKKEKMYTPKRSESFKDDKKSTTPRKTANETNPNSNAKGSRTKNSEMLKKKEQPKSRPNHSSLPVEEKADESEVVDTEKSSKETPATSLLIQKIAQAKKRRVPAYMLTSYLPAPMEIVKKQQQKMNRYLLNMNGPNMKDYLSDLLKDTQQKNMKNMKNVGEAMFSKELDYLIRLQMCLNNEISTNIENSMNYVKTLLSQDYNGVSIIDKIPEPMDIYESRNKGIVLIEMNEGVERLGGSSSNSDNTEESEKYPLKKDSSDGKQITKSKSINLTANESGDSQMIDSTMINELDATEEYNSDSGFNCEISITLNAVEGDHDPTVHDTIAPINSICQLGTDPNYNIGQNQIADSYSQVSLKPHRKKRKDNEISAEMKQKLLEILEEEIKREMEANYIAPSENPSETMVWKWEDQDMINRNQSAASSSDNIEFLTQISETMRQYLSEFIERRFTGRNEKPSDEKRKSKDMS